LDRVEREKALLEVADRLEPEEVLAGIDCVAPPEDRGGQEAALDVVAYRTR
jgi:hypothetical protein